MECSKWRKQLDIDKFTEFKTGKLLPIESAYGEDWAFLPNPLPPQLNMTNRTWGLIAEARQKIGDLNGSGSRLSDARLLLRPLQRREALRSSSLEGTYVTPIELLLFEKSHKSAQGKETNRENQWREVHNYYKAIKIGHRKISRGQVFNREFFCDLHRILMEGVRGEHKNPGKIRERQVHVGIDWRFNPPPASELENCLSNLEEYHQDGLFEEVDPLVRAFVAHYQFEAIHPFTDGNGRIGRVLLSLGISRWLNLSHPWLYLSESFENHRADYINTLFRVSTQGEWNEWLELCAHATIEQADSSIARCKALETLRENYFERISKGKGSVRLHRVIEMLFVSPLISIIEVKDKLNVTYHTARGYIKKLMEADILRIIEDEFPKMYAADEVLRIAYVD